MADRLPPETPKRRLRIVRDEDIRTWGHACCGGDFQTILFDTYEDTAPMPACPHLELSRTDCRCTLFDSELFTEHFDDGDGSDVRPVRSEACKQAEAMLPASAVVAVHPSAPTYTKVTSFRGRSSGDCECFCFDRRTEAELALDEQMPREMVWEQHDLARIYPDELLPPERYPDPASPHGASRMGKWTITASFVPDQPTEAERQAAR